MLNPASVRFRGPLKPHVDGLWSDLLRQGYSPLYAVSLLRIAAHLSRWLDNRRLAPRDLTSERIAAFALHRRRQGYTQALTPRSLGPVLDFLRKRGAAPPPASPPATAIDRLVREYADHLAAERGLALATIVGYTRFAWRFASERRLDNRRKWAQLKPRDITAFVLEEARRWQVGQVKHEVTSFRSLLRYVHVRGWIDRDLASCVPAVAGWRLAGLPKSLEPDQVRRLLASCDRRSTRGRRDRAILLLVLRLGLRAGDLAALALDDVDWRAGEVILRGKGRRESRLPLPRDVGRAVADYLRGGRPPSSSRRVFIRSHAPHVPLTVSGICMAARHALRRAGLAGGTHVLRHTAATQMLHRGASLPEIGHVLRHRHLDTTAIYAKVDFAALRTVVRPWPGGVA